MDLFTPGSFGVHLRCWKKSLRGHFYLLGDALFLLRRYIWVIRCILFNFTGMKFHKNVFFFLATLCGLSNVSSQHILQSFDGRISFLSEAPLEVIRASSGQLRGALDKKERTFAFTVEISSFEGFNSPLQRQHFNENYMETKKFPKAIFTGKIIEKVDFNMPGVYQVRAKGKLSIHGEEKERIIRSELTIHEDGSVSIASGFSVPLKDHSIRIPKIVFQKIAEVIQVDVSIQLESEGT